MYTVGIRELKDKLSQYLHYARQGERVVITKRGNPILVIQPIEDMEPPSTPELELAQLAREGAVRLRRGHTTGKVPPPLKLSGPSVSSAVIEDRR